MPPGYLAFYEQTIQEYGDTFYCLLVFAQKRKREDSSGT
jgi:hypothetical protein